MIEIDYYVELKVGKINKRASRRDNMEKELIKSNRPFKTFTPIRIEYKIKSMIIKICNNKENNDNNRKQQASEQKGQYDRTRNKRKIIYDS